MSESPERYEPSEIEPKWQQYWEERKTFATRRRPGAPKAYLLDMFPYPSGSGLHVGHPEGYTATDIMARFRRMQGVDVLHPMGWDAFGLPAEQYAIQTGTHPRATTLANIATFRRQLKMLGFSYDWSREVDTTDPGYVKWTQWIFLQLFHRGLAYQDKIRQRCAARARCSPTKRWSTAAASVATTRWSGCRCASGCSASPPTPTGWPTISRASTGRRPSTSSGTGSARARARGSISRWSPATASSRSSPPGPTSLAGATYVVVAARAPGRR